MKSNNILSTCIAWPFQLNIVAFSTRTILLYHPQWLGTLSKIAHDAYIRQIALLQHCPLIIERRLLVHLVLTNSIKMHITHSKRLMTVLKHLPEPFMSPLFHTVFNLIL